MQITITVEDWTVSATVANDLDLYRRSDLDPILDVDASNGVINTHDLNFVAKMIGMIVSDLEALIIDAAEAE